MPVTPSNIAETGLDAQDSTDVAANATTLHNSDNYAFAAQYIDTGATADATAVTPMQIAAEQAGGLSTVSIFQTLGTTSNPNRGSVHYESYLTENQGEIDAAQAVSDAQKLGQPAGSAIYFSMDFDPGQSSVPTDYSYNYTEATTLANVQNYFTGINKYMNSLPANERYSIGVYGAGDTINDLANQNLVSHGWLTLSSGWAGSGSQIAAAQIYQQNTISESGVNGSYQIDPDDTTQTDVGQWTAICFASGTTIRTLRGDIAVEELTAGDFAVTASGALRPIVWVGQRTIDCTKAPVPSEVWPVRIRAHAFGEDLPERDLFLSPGHPVLVGSGDDEVLVPIMCLVNGTTIARTPVDAVTYWHVELDQHDILLAEGLPAESYLDFGTRPWFENGSDHALYNPDFVAPGLDGRCRPVAIDGPIVEAERRRLDGVFAMRLAAQCAWPSAEGVEAGM